MKQRIDFDFGWRSALRVAAVCFALAILGAAPVLGQQSEATPQATVEALHRALIEAARRTEVEERYRVLEAVVTATHDLPYIAEFALRRQWPALSAADRERFVAAFETLSVMTYASRFANVDADTFTITGSEPAASGRTTVTATVARANGEPVTLEYLLQRTDDGWRIINIVADGVSDLALKRSEYQAALASGTLDDLIAELEAQTASLAESAAR